MRKKQEEEDEEEEQALERGLRVKEDRQAEEIKQKRSRRMEDTLEVFLKK